MGSVSPPKNLDWQKTGLTTYSRELGASEKVLRCFADQGKPIGKTNVPLMGIIDYHSTRKDMIPIFRQAWQHVRVEHPIIATRMTSTWKRTFDVDDPIDKADETFHIIEDKEVKDVINAIGVIEVAELYVFPKKSKIMCATGHDFSDGRGQLLFLDLFFKAVEAIVNGTIAPPIARDPLAALAPSFDAVANPEVPPTAYEEAMRRITAGMPLNIGIGGHNFGELPSGEADYVGVQFSETETAAIMAKTKGLKTTLSPVLHTAVAMAQNKYLGQESSQYSSFVPVDVRKHAGETGLQPMTCQVFVGMFLAEIGDWSKTLHEMQKGYDLIRSDFESGVLHAVTETTTMGIQSMGDMCPPPPRAVFDLSNPGRADDFLRPVYGPIEIRRVNLTCRDCFTMLMMVLTSFRGKIRASIGFNDRYHRREEVERLAVLFKEILLRELGIERDCDALETEL